MSALASGAGVGAAERWLKHLRFGREYGEPTVAVAEKAPAALKILKDRRRMRDSRLYRTCAGLPDETLIYVWAVGDDGVRERVERFIGVVSRVQPEVTGEDLIALGLPPGPVFSAILAQALDDRLDRKAVGREPELANLKRLVARRTALSDSQERPKKKQKTPRRASK